MPGSAANNEPAKHREYTNRERPHVLRNKIKRQSDRANATDDAANDDLGSGTHAGHNDVSRHAQDDI